MLIIGADPGGEGAFGLAIVRVKGKALVEALRETVDSVDDALAWFKESLKGETPSAAGIDTFLTWATSRAGWRPQDELLRSEYSSVSNSVFASNSAFGSMAIQGMALALELRRLWPGIMLNETHPKVLYFQQSQQKYSWGQGMRRWLEKALGMPSAFGNVDSHQFDALLSAWATAHCCGGLTPAWTHDLRNEAKNLIEPVGQTHYFWPTAVR